MSLANIQGKLSRAEMKNIMAGLNQDPINAGCKGILVCREDSHCALDGGTNCKCKNGGCGD